MKKIEDENSLLKAIRRIIKVGSKFSEEVIKKAIDLIYKIDKEEGLSSYEIKNKKIMVVLRTKDKLRNYLNKSVKESLSIIDKEIKETESIMDILEEALKSI